MEYKQVHLPAMKMVGIGVDTAVGKTGVDCPKVWGTFMSRLSEIKNQKTEMVQFGVATQPNAETCTMRYTACTEVDSATEIPEGMDIIELPESDYYVFTHKGKLDLLNQTYGDVMATMQTSERKQKEDFWLEQYDDRYKVDSDDSEFDILVPIM
jgi:AraC family transcriptional regulator